MEASVSAKVMARLVFTVSCFTDPDKEITENLFLVKENILRKTIFVHPLRDIGEMLLQEQNGQSSFAELAI